jgi:GAF domain-containing protein
MLEREGPAPSALPPERLQFERLLAELSARFVNLSAAEVDGAITDALRRIVEILGVDRAALHRYPPTGEALVTHWWAAEGVPGVVSRSLSQLVPWAHRRVRSGQPLLFARLDDLPPEAELDKTSIGRHGIKSIVTMPMVVAGRVEGALALASLRKERTWPEDLVERIHVLATILANALAHKRAQEALDAAMGFERTVSDVLAALVMAGRAELDRVIEAGLRDMARVFGAERATLWQRSGEKAEFTRTHGWGAEGVPSAPNAVGAVTTPWISTELVRGSVVRFACRADLPPEAAGDLPGLQALGIRAGVAVPLAVSGAVVGALSFAAVQKDRDWPDTLVPRVKFLGEVFANVLARREAERREEVAKAEAAHAARVATMGTLAASLAHELTQPVAAIMSNAEAAVRLLAQRPPDLAELRGALEDIITDDRRAGDLIQEQRRFLSRGEVTKCELALA